MQTRRKPIKTGKKSKEGHETNLKITKPETQTKAKKNVKP